MISDYEIHNIKCNASSGGRNLTCDQTLASVSSGEGVDAVRGVWDLVSSIFDGDGVTARHVWHVGHRVRSVSVVPNVCRLWFSLWILQEHGQEVSTQTGS